MKKIGIISLGAALTLTLGLTLGSCASESSSSASSSASASASATTAATSATTAATTATTAATATPTPTPTATTPAKDPDFTDDFSKVDAKWKIYGKDLEIKDGVFNVKASEGGKALYEAKKYKNVTIEADITVSEGECNAGFIFSVSDPKESGADSYKGYYAGISTSQAIVGKANQDWKELKVESIEVEANKKVAIKVVVKAGSIEFYVDGDLVVEVDDDEYTDDYAEGYVGIRTYKNDATFDNFKITIND